MQRRIGSFLQGVQNLVPSITKFCGRGRVPSSACEGEENTEKTYWRRWYLNWVLEYLWASLSSFINKINEPDPLFMSWVEKEHRDLKKNPTYKHRGNWKQQKTHILLGTMDRALEIIYRYVFLSEGVAPKKFNNFSVKLQPRAKNELSYKPWPQDVQKLFLLICFGFIF